MVLHPSKIMGVLVWLQLSQVQSESSGQGKETANPRKIYAHVTSTNKHYLIHGATGASASDSFENKALLTSKAVPLEICHKLGKAGSFVAS